MWYDIFGYEYSRCLRPSHQGKGDRRQTVEGFKKTNDPIKPHIIHPNPVGEGLAPPVRMKSDQTSPKRADDICPYAIKYNTIKPFETAGASPRPTVRRNDFRLILYKSLHERDLPLDGEGGPR